MFFSMLRRSIPDWSKLLRSELFSRGKIAPSLTEGTDNGRELVAMDDTIEEGTMHIQVAVVVNTTQLPKLTRKTTDTRPLLPPCRPIGPDGSSECPSPTYLFPKWASNESSTPAELPVQGFKGTRNPASGRTKRPAMRAAEKRLERRDPHLANGGRSPSGVER